MNRRRIILYLLLLATLVATAVHAGGHLRMRRAAALAAMDDLRGVQRDAARIESLRRLPARAGDSERLAGEVTALLEAAAAAADVGLDQIVRITPQPGRRVGQTVFTAHPTTVLLRGLTLQQLAAFAHAAGGDDAGLHVESIRLSAPRAELAAQTWTAEIAVSYLIYDPPETQP